MLETHINNCMLEPIKIYKLNPFTIRLELDKTERTTISRNLSTFFSLYAPNYLYDPRYKRKIWDGKIRFYDSKTSTLPIGLFSELKEFCNIYDYEYELVDKIHTNNFLDVSPENIELFIQDLVKSYNIPEKFFPIRPYQYKYFAKFVAKNTILAESPTASGKSLIIYFCIRYALSTLDLTKDKVLLIVPTIQLVEQMYKDFQDYGFNSEKYCARIYSSSKDTELKLDSDKLIIISTWQSLYKLPKEKFESVKMIVGDEIHEFGAQKAKSVLLNCKNALYRMGTTGTLKHTDKCSMWTIIGLFDTISKYTDTMTLVKEGHIVSFDINVVNLIYPEEVCKMSKGFAYQEEIDYIGLQKNKFEFLSKLTSKIISSDENVLLLFKNIEYGKRLKEYIDSELNINSFYVDGSVKIEDRENIRDVFEISNSQVAICSFGTFSRGINIKNLSNLVLVNSIKTEIRLLQSIGRTLRLHENKKKSKIWDIVDNLTYKSYTNYCMKHFYERKDIYDQNGFNINYVDINLK